MDPMSPRTLADRSWELYFAAFKAVFVFVSSLLHGIALLALFLIQWGVYGTGWLVGQVDSWYPMRPEIFEVPQRH